MKEVYPLRKVGLARLALLVGLFVSPLLPAAIAQDKLPALGFIPNSFSSEQQAKFTQERDALEKQLSAFQSEAKDFNDKTAENQTDTEYNALQAQRAEYITAANAFNQALAAAEATAEARAALPAAKVFARGSSGFYFVTKDGLKLSGADGVMLPLDGGTHVVTGPDSHIKLLLPDETLFTIGPDADVVLDDFVFDPNTSVGKISAALIKGTFRWVTGKIVSHEGNHLRIAVGCLGIRGTDFEAVVTPNGSGQIELFSGELEITPHAGGLLPHPAVRNSSTFLLNAGEMVTFTVGGTFSAPTPLKQEANR
jgi:hypothetical protein